MSSASFARFATTSASTKRNPAAAAGTVGVPATYLSGLLIVPLMPVSQEIIERYQLKSPRKSFVTFVEGAPDIAEGDVLVVSTAEYKVVGAEPWPGDQAFYQLVVEKVIGV